MKSFARLDQAEEGLFNIHAGLETTLTLMHHELKCKLVVHRDFGEVAPLYCRPRDINQVFMNLLCNAAQAIDGAGSIRITTRTSCDAVIVEFSDTGRGIPSENLRSIFDPSLTTQGTRIGVGLGLPIAYRIVQDHGGSISVRSEPNKGSTFTVKLPVRRAYGGRTRSTGPDGGDF